MRRFPYYEDRYRNPRYRRGGYREPFYDDIADYNTNAKSYYDYLARFNGFLHDLVDFINDLADRMDGIDDRLDTIEDALQKIVNNLYDSGAVDSKDLGKFKFNKGRDIATGNINVFTNKPDGATYIRTNKGKTEFDIVVGYEK
jgi:hypothetical protein